MARWNGRRRTDPHEKSMGSYELFAWRDAMSVGSMLEEECNLPKARKIYEAMTPEAIMEFEEKNCELLKEFIGKSEVQRHTYFERITKESSEGTKVLFLVLAILGLVRVMRMLELRDAFRTVLAPGRGNRITAAGVYGFAAEVDACFEYEWPSEVFEAYGADDFGDDDDDSDA